MHSYFISISSPILLILILPLIDLLLSLSVLSFLQIVHYFCHYPSRYKFLITAFILQCFCMFEVSCSPQYQCFLLSRTLCIHDLPIIMCPCCGILLKSSNQWLGSWVKNWALYFLYTQENVVLLYKKHIFVFLAENKSNKPLCSCT